jgi:nucleotide-binding universal stress UspA family protein
VTQKNARRPIISGTDFSATAREAVDIAAAMARQLETKLILVYVEQLVASLVSNPLLFEAAILQRRADLKDEAERLRNLETEVEEKFVLGSPVDELAKAARKSRARLVVLGAVGHGLAVRLLLGSVAERTAETSPVPTLVVRPGGRLGSWIRGEHPLKVLVGYDFSSASDAALEWVNQLRAIGKVEITVLYSAWFPDEARRLGHQRSLASTPGDKQVQSNLERDLKKRVASFLPIRHVNTMVEPGWGRPEGYLFQTATREHVDLIVVGTNQRSGVGRFLLGSVSRDVLHHAKVTVAVIPPTGAARSKREK